MNTIQIGLVTLLKSAVTGEKYLLPEDFSIKEAYPLIKSHHMTTLVFDGAVRCGISQQEPVMQQMFRAYCKAMLRSEGQMAMYAKLCQAFDEGGIDYMPLKGCRMKALYPKPELRTMGDADILIRVEQYDRIIPVVESLGFQHVLDSDHELIWSNSQLLLELHKRVIPSYNQDFYAYFGEGWQLAKPDAGNSFSMSAEDELVYLFTHFAKHYRDGGIGCRHVLDLWVYLRAHPDLDDTYIRQNLSMLNLVEFYENIQQLLDVWFSEAVPSEKTEFITDFIFASGSWGRLETKAMSSGVRNKGKTGNAAKSKLKYLFPNTAALRDKYKVLQKAPWLLPIVWLIRFINAVFIDRKHVSARMKKMTILTPENLKSREDALNYVGLDYNF